jgi:hypothetical protein
MADQRRRFDLSLVVDPSYQDGLEELATAVPVWIVGTAVNKEACQRVWDRQPSITDHRLPGCITSYDVSDEKDRVSNLLSVLPVLEEHYGESDDDYMPLSTDPQRRYLHLPNGFGLNVVGLSLTEDLRPSLEDFGLNCVIPTAFGFQAWVRRKRAT